MKLYLRQISAGQLTIIFFLITALLSGTAPVFAAGQTKWLAFQNYGSAGMATGPVVFQPDGKILVVNTIFGNPLGAPHSFFAVTRLLPSGGLDASFDGDGKLIDDFDDMHSSISAVAVQADGKIVAAGQRANQPIFARFNSDGSLDTSFNGTGKFVLDIPASLSSLAILPDGKILAGGSINSQSTGADFTLFRLNTDGSFDKSFDGDGIVVSPVTDRGDYINAIAVQPDGKIVAAGTADFGSLEGNCFIVIRYTSAGALDPAFDKDGFTLTDFGEPNESAETVAVAADGKIVAAGYSTAPFNLNKDLITRFNADGSYDASFSGDGKVVTQAAGTSSGAVSRITRVALQSNGKIVTAGWSYAPVTPSASAAVSVVRYRRDGSLDTSFGGHGILALEAGTGSDYGRSVVIRPNSDIIVAGNNSDGKFNGQGFVFSLTGDQQTFADFDADGKTDLSEKVGTGDWIFRLSSTGFVSSVSMHSVANRRIVPADYDGDGRTDAAEWSYVNGNWIITESSTGLGRQPIFGANGDIPAPADFDGDGKADLAVFRPSNGYWYINNSSDGSFSFIPWGSSGDIPVVGDYDADGRSDQAIFRRNAATGFGEWWIQYSGGGNFVTVFGTNTDVPVAADYTGDGKTDVAVWRPSDGFWFILRSEDFNYYAAPFGQAGDYLVPGDYDGDGRSDIAVARNSTRFWYINQSSAGIIFQQFGGNGARPIPSAYIP